VIAVFNCKNILGLTHDILKETYSNYRCVIVDDGSTDFSAALARTYQDADLRFQVVGKLDCRQCGVQLPTGLFNEKLSF
jgi:glycosyltransferase involved in cell wall biosynthesis